MKKEIMLTLMILLVLPLASASLDEFMSDTSSIEVLYQGTDSEIMNVIDDFGLGLVTELDTTKKTIVINADEILSVDSVSLHLVAPRTISYMEEDANLIKIYLKELPEIEGQSNINEKHEILTEFFSFLNAPDTKVFMLEFEASGLTKYAEQDFEQLNAVGIYQKEAFNLAGNVLEEKCDEEDSNKLYELSCNNNQVGFNIIQCVNGCTGGKCKKGKTFGTFSSLVARLLMRTESHSRTELVDEIKEWLNK